MSQEATVDAATLRYSLAGLRGTVFLVMLMWTIDKFLNPDHTAAVFGALVLENFDWLGLESVDDSAFMAPEPEALLLQVATFLTLVLLVMLRRRGRVNSRV